MAESTGYILAAAGITAANEVVFKPLATGTDAKLTDFNWRILPATAVAAFALAGLEKVSPPLGKGLAVLALIAALMVPSSRNTLSPIDNVSAMLGLNRSGSAKQKGS